MKLSKEELLNYLEICWFSIGASYEKARQAYQQIRQLIENQPEVDITFIDKWVGSIFLSLEHYIQENDTTEANNQLETHLRKLLQEAGVKTRRESNE